MSRASRTRRPLELRVDVAAHARLRREPPDAQHARGAVGLQVGTTDEAVTGEERQHVVTVRALVLALVDLDDVPEAEQPLEQRPVPDEVVERADERRRRRRAVELLARQDVERRAAVVDLDLAQPALRDERVEVRLQARACRPSSASARGSRPPSARRARRPRAATARQRLGLATASAHRARASGSPARRGRSGAGSCCRPAIARWPRSQSASSTIFAGFQFHIPPPPCPSKSREPSGPSSRMRASTGSTRSACSRSARSGSPSGRRLHRRLRKWARARSAAATPRAPSTRRSALRRAAARPLARVGADARAERQPVRAVDGRDRVELHRGQPADRRLDVASSPRRNRAAYPWRPTTSRRTAVSETAIS